jgi:copper chaperone NosL
LSPRVARLLFGLTLVLSACGEDETARPEAQALTREAIGYYCNMIVADHLGPKGQVILKSQAEPLWFASVRDAIAFTLLPGEPKDIAAIYVNDMARATWDAPEPDTWIDARAAWYVIDSTRRGGMGAPEAVPFSDLAAAELFAAEFGGHLAPFEDIPEDFILGGVETPDDVESHNMPAHDTMDGMTKDAGHGK